MRNIRKGRREGGEGGGEAKFKEMLYDLIIQIFVSKKKRRNFILLMIGHVSCCFIRFKQR